MSETSTSMRWFKRKNEQRREDVIAALSDLRREFPDPLDQSLIGDAILYANVGRDRYDLTMDYVETVRGLLATHPWRLGAPA